MPSHDNHADLTERLTQLEARVERLVASVADYVQLVARRVDILDREKRNAYERIIHLELKVFPHLQGDINRLHDIIGDYHDKADQPLDRREPKSP